MHTPHFVYSSIINEPLSASSVFNFPSLFIFFFNFYWSIVDLQCCVSFCCTASESVIHVHIYIHYFFRFFFHIGHYRVLSRVPCAIQQVVISYLFYIQQCVYVNPSLPINPSPPYPLVTISLFSTSVALYLYCR